MSHHRTTPFTMLALVVAMCSGARPAQAGNRPVTIVIHVVDHSRLTPADRGGMEREAARIFAAAGVHLEWRDGFDRWNGNDGRVHVGVVILDARMGKQQMGADRLEPNALGEAVRQARRAYVFHDRVAGLLFKDPTKLAPALGAVVAHEIGHLLLPVDSHSGSGVMQPALSLNLLVPQRFTEVQSIAIRMTVAAAQHRPSEAQLSARAAK